MKEMSGKGKRHVGAFMALYLEDIYRIKALVENSNRGFFEMRGVLLSLHFWTNFAEQWCLTHSTIHINT